VLATVAGLGWQHRGALPVSRDAIALGQVSLNVVCLDLVSECEREIE
jgi:hypothetical protein